MELTALFLISISSFKTRMLHFKSICKMGLPKIRCGMEYLCQGADTTGGEFVLQPSLQGGDPTETSRAPHRRRCPLTLGGLQLQRDIKTALGLPAC